jgi:DNA-directed RNA polymerase subunit M/transcription elongation factor TFIIS
MATATHTPTTTVFNSEFCARCHNLMLVETADGGRSQFRCRACKHTVAIRGSLGRAERRNATAASAVDEPSSQPRVIDRIVMLVRNYQGAGTGAGAADGSAFTRNPDLVLSDVSLPRIELRCPRCATMRCVAYMKIDKSTMTNRYVCSSCKHSWTNRDTASVDYMTARASSSSTS